MPESSVLGEKMEQLARECTPVPDVTISIINTNNRQMTLDCLRSVFANTHHATLEVCVVDNACTDGSAEAIRTDSPQVRLICNERRLGFSTNNNLVFRQAQGCYLLMLNDDTLIQPGALDRMVEFMDAHPEAGVVGAKLLNPDGSNQPAFSRFYGPIGDLVLKPVHLRLTAGRYDVGDSTEVDAVGGACMLIRHEAAEQVGYLDPTFDPLYSEEIDWCFRIREAGWKIYHLPQAMVIHYGSQTMNRAPLTKLEQLHRGKTRFFLKHFGVTGAWCYKVTLFVLSVFKVLFYGLTSVVNCRSAVQKVRINWHIAKRAFFL
ncbi:MAG: glycosyltransferase family 2 protein [Anaerolineae bacterium]|nr:glycosyltransferase family 2 protein [Anaerolineae bacterium]